MSWTLTVTAITDDGVEKKTFSSAEHGLSSPDFTRGFISGYGAAQGLKPGQIVFELKEDAD